jgi:cathepsin D
VNKQHIDGDMHWIPVLDDMLHANVWSASLTAVALNGLEIDTVTNRTGPDPYAQFITSGSPRIYAPLIGVQYMAFETKGTLTQERAEERDIGTNTLIVPCEGKLELGLEMGGQVYTVPKKSLITHDLGEGTCATNIVGSDYYAKVNGWTLGEPFGSNYYMAYSFDKPAVGIATRAAVAHGATLDGKGGNKKCATTMKGSPLDV